MKLKSLRISGFRGVPPVEPPDVALDFISGTTKKNVLIFGPNAYGKSSIADAIEWFFKERVRGADYVENYENRDNVHLNLGRGDNPAVAWIELEIRRGNQDYTVRKELDTSGNKTAEILDGLDGELDATKNELLVLDHDQFRQFVSAASKDKWTTFSSLIGYEELDHFRAGLDSLSQNSATTYFNLTQLRREAENKQQTWRSNARDAADQFDLDSDLDDPEMFLATMQASMASELEIILSSLELPMPEGMAQIPSAFWMRLRQHTQPADPRQHAASRIDALESLASALNPFDRTFHEQFAQFQEDLTRLAGKKDRFDKQIVADFYEKGLEIIREGNTSGSRCPFCETAINLDELQVSVVERLTALDIGDLQQESKELIAGWNNLNAHVKRTERTALGSNLSSIHDSVQEIPDDAAVQQALSLSDFDESIAVEWCESVSKFSEVLSEQAEAVVEEKDEIERDMEGDPSEPLRIKIEMLASLQEAWHSLSEQYQNVREAEHRCQVTENVIQDLREVARSFRDELSDFSGRVIELINHDINRYYDALHPGDDVKPFLETDIVGKQRRVRLKCTYLGRPDREAVTLLSESHRNSLGLAIMLAFMKYKRRTGSEVEFLVLDDVTQSFDVGHRLGLINFLTDQNFPEICDSQVIFLTHDRTLADLIARPGEQVDDWIRYDIRSWQLNNVYITPNDTNLLERAQSHLDRGDDLAAAVYARHALERLYREIVDAAKVLMPYTSKPWHISLGAYENHITSTIKDLWANEITVMGNTLREGIIDPNRIRIDELNRALRLLHMTVHDSDFLDNPPSAGEIRTALDAISQLQDKFTCPNCRANSIYRYFHSLARDPQGNPPKCKRCKERLPAH